MKILYITTIGITMNFFKALIKHLMEDGHTVHIATNDREYKVDDCYYEWRCKVYQIDCSRSPFQKGNIAAIKQIRKIVEETQYDIVHCHTPIVAACTRLACRNVRKNRTKVFYTAHGFHFYKGAPWQNWLIFYPIEKICSYMTDVLITINTEDYTLAQKCMKAKRIVYVPGVGIDLQKFGKAQTNHMEKRRELGIPKDALLLLSVGELNENKNHEVVIRALSSLVKTQKKEIYYIIAGVGNLKDHLQKLIDEVGLSAKVQLIGYRTDIAELCQVADIFIFPSYREGLSVSVMEAMASGMPVACSRIRGNVDLIDEADINGDGKGVLFDSYNGQDRECGGVLFDPHSVQDCTDALERLLYSNREKMGEYNRRKIQDFKLETVNAKLTGLYDMKKFE